MTDYTTEGQIFFQLQEPVRNDVVTVSNTSVRLAETRNEATKRKVILVRNTVDPTVNPTYIVTVHLGQNVAVAGYGIVLKPGESFYDVSGEGYECYQGVITCINAVAGNATLAVMER